MDSILATHILDSLPSQAADLITKLLTYCPQQRLTAEQALSHPLLAP